MKKNASWEITIERGNLWKEARTKCNKLVLSNIVMTRTSSTLQWMTKTSTSTSQVYQNAILKRSHSINVHNLIQQIENHPHRQALQSDLQQHRAFNPFSEESKDAIMAAWNTELCEIVEVEPKSQCRTCLTYWSAGIVYCTCVTPYERWYYRKQEVHLIRAGFVLHPELLHKEGPATRSQVRKSTWLQRIPHGKTTSKRGVSKEKVWKHSRSIHPRQVLQKNDDRVGSLWRDHPWDGSACKRWPVILPQKKKLTYNVATGGFAQTCVNFDTMPTRHLHLISRKHCRHCTA